MWQEVDAKVIARLRAYRAATVQRAQAAAERGLGSEEQHAGHFVPAKAAERRAGGLRLAGPPRNSIFPRVDIGPRVGVNITVAHIHLRAVSGTAETCES